MNIKLIGVAVIAILLIGAGGFLALNKSKTPTNNANGTSNTGATSSGNSSNSLLDLISSGKTQKCSFSYNAGSGSSTNGIVYVTANKMRGDISTTTSGKESKFMMIRDGDITYIWGGDLKTGIKMKLSDADLKTNTQANQYFNTTQKTNYDCSSWSADSSVFNIPTDVKFTDITSMQGGAMMEGSQKTGTTVSPQGQYNPCTTCAGLSGSAKTSCLQLYKC